MTTSCILQSSLNESLDRLGDGGVGYLLLVALGNLQFFISLAEVAAIVQYAEEKTLSIYSHSWFQSNPWSPS